MNEKLLSMLSKLQDFIPERKISNSQIRKIMRELRKQYRVQDPWGLDLKSVEKALRMLAPLYENYFRVRVFGKEKVQDCPYLMVSNHSGQIAIDGLLIGMAFALDVFPPRIVRPMIERFMAALPFVAEASNKVGAVLGDRENCLYLLERKQSVLVFPEGVRGVSKSTDQFYELQKFTRGFYRMALSTKTPILPIAVIGAEELYPFVYQAKGLAKLLGLPALPITPFFPWLGPIGALPLPSPIDIYIGDPVEIPVGLSADAPDKDIDAYIAVIENQIKKMIQEGLKNRRDFIDSKGLITRLKK